MAQKEKLVRIEVGHEPVEARIKHFHEFTVPLTEKEAAQQAKRCLHCGTPFCSSQCPLHNRPVDFNKLAADGRWHAAWEALAATNSFPEFTSRVCPALCESGCAQRLLEGAGVGIQSVERTIIDRAWKSGWVTPRPATSRTGKRVAVIGSGPAGLACAQQLARVGHDVTVFEKAEKAGGLLRYGIPDFKLAKDLIDRRVEQMQAEGVTFETLTAAGVKSFEVGIHNPAKKFVSAEKIRKDFDAVVLACGSETPRDWVLPGRNAKGVTYALDLLIGQNRATAGEAKTAPVSCRGCDVIVLGSGDTGSDCIGVARRQGAGRIVQVARSPEPPKTADVQASWPQPAPVLKTSSSQAEGCERLWSLMAKEFLVDDKGAVRGVKFAKLEWAVDKATGRRVSKEVPDSFVEIPAQRVLLAIGFAQPSASLLKAFGVASDKRGNAVAEKETGDAPFATTAEGVFACGDVRRGQSLVAHALHEGRCCAAAVDRFLMKAKSELPCN